MNALVMRGCLRISGCYLAVAWLTLALLAGCAVPAGRQTDSFVRVRDGAFYLQGRPYYFAGTNLWYGAYLGSPGKMAERMRLRRELDILSRHGRAAEGAPIAGSNFWGWGGFGRARGGDFIWREGDPFTGDPPQEPQGLNSVFDVDASTLAILRAHAEAMQSLSNK